MACLERVALILGQRSRSMWVGCRLKPDDTRIVSSLIESSGLVVRMWQRDVMIQRQATSKSNNAEVVAVEMWRGKNHTDSYTQPT
eukprot:scaffold18187_cov118-Skeletonema_dohrnii-CCMP3373.AAC.1